MALTVTCPGCQAVHKVKDTARGKKVRCPTEGCGRVLTIPTGAATSAPATATPVDAASPSAEQGDTFRLALPLSDTVPAPAKRARTAGPPPSVPVTRLAEREVLLPDGSIKAMSKKQIQHALVKGQLTRFSLLRTVGDDEGASNRRRSDEQAWQPIGYNIFIDTQDDPAHVTRAARVGMSHRDTVATITVWATVVLLGLAAGWGLYQLPVTLDVKVIGLIAAAATFGTVLQPLMLRFGLEYMASAFVLAGVLAGVVFGVIVTMPEMSVFILKSIAFVFSLFVAHVLGRGLGWLSGIAFDYGYRMTHRDPEDTGPERQKKERPPFDGYPWMFWKGREQRRLLQEALDKSAKS